MLFKSYSKRKVLYSNLVQIIVIALVLPYLIFLINSDVVVNLIEKIPIFSAWITIVKDAHSLSSFNFSWMLLENILETLILGLSVHIFNSIIKVNGLPILPTFIGIIAGSALLLMFTLMPSYRILFCILSLIIGFILLLKSAVPKIKLLSPSFLLNILVDVILSAALSSYIATLALFSKGRIAYTSVLLFAGISIALLIAKFFTNKLKF